MSVEELSKYSVVGVVAGAAVETVTDTVGAAALPSVSVTGTITETVVVAVSGGVSIFTCMFDRVPVLSIILERVFSAPLSPFFAKRDSSTVLVLGCVFNITRWASPLMEVRLHI